MSIPGPTTYADLHPGELSFKEKIQALHPDTVYSGKTYSTPGYAERMALMKSLIGSDMPAGSYNGVVYSGKHTWAELGLEPGSGSDSDTPTITANTANGGYANRTMIVTEGSGGVDTITPQPIVGGGGILGAIRPPMVPRDPPTIPTPTPIPTPGTVAPGDSPTSSITGAAVAGIAALFLLSFIGGK